TSRAWPTWSSRTGPASRWHHAPAARRCAAFQAACSWTRSSPCSPAAVRRYSCSARHPVSPSVRPRRCGSASPPSSSPAATRAAPASPAGLCSPGAARPVAQAMKIALAHEYFSARGGAENVVDVLHGMWPDAPVYTFFHDRARFGALDGWHLVTSSLQSFPIGGGMHRLLLPLYPAAARRLRVPSDIDVAVVSTSAFIKGLSLDSRTVEVAYCHSPTR